MFLQHFLQVIKYITFSDLQVYVAGPLYSLPVTVLLYIWLWEGFWQNWHNQGLLHLLSSILAVCSVLSICPHLTLTSLPERFLFILYVISGFSGNASLLMHFPIKCQCLSMILFILGLAGLKVRMRGIICFLVLVCSLSRSEVSLFFLALSKAFPISSFGYPCLMTLCWHILFSL